MNGEITLYNLLKNDATFYGLLSTIDGYKALAVARVEPESWGISHTTGSVYNAVGVNNANPSLVTDLTLNCRAPSEGAVKTLAAAAISAINLVQTSEGEFYCFTGGIIPPENEDDSYNLPITVTVKAVKGMN